MNDEKISDALQARLVGILVADAVAYSLAMAEDGPGTVARLDAARTVFRDRIGAHGGRVVDMAGDSVLALFASAAGAVRAALEVQQRLAADPNASPRALPFRIGVHLGDVFEKADGSAYGDGVNVAARLQTLAAAGTVVASDAIRAAVERQLPYRFEALGPQTLHNLGQPLLAHKVHEGHRQAAESASPRGTRKPRASRRTRSIIVAAVLVVVVLSIALTALRWRNADSARITGPRSIVVLPFSNLGSAADDDYFSDGISEELINRLGQLPGSRVIARTTAFRFKRLDVPIAEMGRQLGVRYVVEGSVRRDAGRLRITARLTDARDGAMLWTDIFDRPIADSLSVQAELALVLARKLELQISRADLAARGGTDAEAQRIYFEATQAIYEQTSAGLDKAEALLGRALAIDPSFLPARARLLDVRWNRLYQDNQLTFRHRGDAAARGVLAEARALVARAPTLAEAHVTLGLALFAVAEREAALAEMRMALELNPSLPQAHQFLGVQLLVDGRMDEALDALQRAVETDPLAPNRLSFQAHILLMAGRPAAALDAADRVIALQPGRWHTRLTRISALALLGRLEEARADLRAWSSTTAEPALAVGIVARVDIAAARRMAGEALQRPLPPKANAPAAADQQEMDIAALLVLGRPTEAFARLGDPLDMNIDELPLRTFYHLEWDPIRRNPAYLEALRTLGLVEAHARAQEWRARQPPATVGR